MQSAIEVCEKSNKETKSHLKALSTTKNNRLRALGKTLSTATKLKIKKDQLLAVRFRAAQVVTAGIPGDLFQRTYQKCFDKEWFGVALSMFRFCSMAEKKHALFNTWLRAKKAKEEPSRSELCAFLRVLVKLGELEYNDANREKMKDTLRSAFYDLNPVDLPEGCRVDEFDRLLLEITWEMERMERKCQEILEDCGLWF